MPQKIIVAWVSRHPPLPAQIKTLRQKLGEAVRIVPLTDTYNNYRDVLETIGKSGATYAVLVLPLSIISLLVSSTPEITWLRADMMPAEGEYNPETDVIMPSQNGARHLRFKEFQEIISVDVVTIPFRGGE